MLTAHGWTPSRLVVIVRSPDPDLTLSGDLLIDCGHPIRSCPDTNDLVVWVQSSEVLDELRRRSLRRTAFGSLAHLYVLGLEALTSVLLHRFEWTEYASEALQDVASVSSSVIPHLD